MVWPIIPAAPKLINEIQDRYREKNYVSLNGLIFAAESKKYI